MGLRVKAQDIINTYTDPEVAPFTSPPGYTNPALGYETWSSIKDHGSYNGEYQISLREHFWYFQGDQPAHFKYNDATLFDENNYKRTFGIELVSFPFSRDCAFELGGCAGTTDRNLYMPDPGYYNGINRWQYPGTGDPAHTRFLYRDRGVGYFNHGGYSTGDGIKPDGTIYHTAEALVSGAFVHGNPIDFSRYVLPHSILKLTIWFHCGPSDSDPLIASFSFYVDNTRGMMRYYPFSSTNVDLSNNPVYYDIIFKPELFPGIESTLDIHYNNPDNCWSYNNYTTGNNCPDVGYDGGTINYFPYDEIDHICLDNDVQSDGELFATYYMYNGNVKPKFYKVPFAPYTLPVSNFPRSNQGEWPAGYHVVDDVFQPINSPLFPLQFNIDKPIDLTIINPNENVIYNPIEVNISTTAADDLRFPANYTFKTILGAYPMQSQVLAENTTENGGPYTDLRQVPVTTDVRAIASSGYPVNDPKFASVYKLLPNSKLTIEPCVRLFDCTFNLQTGSELVFENWPTNQINVNRYGVLLNGGKLTKGDTHFYFQNKNEYDRILEFRSGTTIEAGDHVTTSILPGPYTVEPNADVTFVANTEITLADGFTALAGSEFDARIEAVVIPSCPPHRPASPHTTLDYAEKAKEALKMFSNASISPNPANQNTEIKFSVNSSKHLSLKVYDAYGREMKTIIDNVEFKTGSYSFSFDSSVLNPGVYYCKLFSDDEEEIIKLVKIN